MKRTLILIFILPLLLSGCSGLLDGSYAFVESHPIETEQSAENVAVSTYAGLLTTIRQMVEDGQEQGLISMGRYDQEKIASDMEAAAEYILHKDPIGAYAVSELTYDLGTSAGQSAVSLRITYLHGRSELRKLQRPEDRAQAEAMITDAVNSGEAGVVLYVDNYQEMDFAQWVAAYATANPDKVMESPEVTANLYPEEGKERVVEQNLHTRTPGIPCEPCKKPYPSSSPPR